jgi:uncharacterized UPF0160 family protein
VCRGCSRLNPSWNAPNGDGVRNANFKRAMAMALEELVACVCGIVLSWLPARSIVEASVAASLPAEGKRGREPPQILKLASFCPWQSHLFELEKERGIEGAFKYCLCVNIRFRPPPPRIPRSLFRRALVLALSHTLPPSSITAALSRYQDSRGSWRVHAVSAALGSFASRKALPEQWRGIRDEELSALTGIAGGIFVHASGFIGGNKTESGAEAMAEKALTM